MMVSRFPRIGGLVGVVAASCFAATLSVAEDPAPLPAAAEFETFTQEQRSHWAFQPLRKPRPPRVEDPSRARNPIDLYILEGLEIGDLSLSPEADRVELIRRITFDLTGLPPTIEEVDAFVDDSRVDAYERVVDRLLTSPRYGERWAQHWLDLAHYADSNGFELDAERPDAWRYRDWVVDALNRDLPYPEFVSLQIAGDEIRPGDVSALIATGFGRCGPREVVSGNIDPEVRRQSELTEVTGTVGSVFLGLTLACARCHDHKFDPIPSTDYYRLQSYFAAAEFVEKPIATKEEEAAFKAAKKAIDDAVAPLRKRMAELEKPYRDRIAAERRAALKPFERAIIEVPAEKRTPEQKKILEGLENSLRVTWEDVAEAVRPNASDHAEREELKRKIERLELTIPPPPAKAMALRDTRTRAPETFVMKRGDVKSKAARVEPRPPGVLLASADLGAVPAPTPLESSTGRRRALAEWLTRPSNPLPARVIVNRLWQHHFGRGLVATPSDFGVRGEPPTHPELLEMLAQRFLDGGGRLAPIHRLMVTSATYRQSSRSRPEAARIDPENTLLWRASRRRMEAEAIRDAMLAVSGELNPKMGGPGVRPPIEKEVEALIFTEAEVVDLWPETPDPREHLRRSLYLFRKRNVRYPMFDAFDAPDTQSACPERSRSTHALQALVLLNSDFASARARGLAERLEKDATTPDDRVSLAYRRVLGRRPDAGELASALEFLDRQTAVAAREQPAEPPSRLALVDFCTAMLNRNEFLYIP
ncbi:MAG: DUF1549 and DUF1553 domain-containing protein [Isosphaeraceae bacterium]|nr:DUF1549 and DUF1553 domain-containing protein [Isosphaeraceae bacterium]